MLIPNKFNGYIKNVRLYNAGGGVGEAMLLGAAMGGGSAAITGGDPLKGALLGGLTGGAGAGISGALAGGAGTTAAITGGTEAGVAGAAIGTGAPTIANTGITALPEAGVSIANPTTAATTTNSVVSNAASPPVMSYDSFGNQVLTSSPAYSMADPSGLVQEQLAINNAATQSAVPPATGGTFTEGMKRFADNPLASIKANPFTAAGAALQGAIGAKKPFEMPAQYSGPLSRYRFNPETYRSAFAEGGITNLASGGYDQQVGEDPYLMASGGISDLGSYSDYANGGRMLKGPGDGMSDSIPASIADKRPARLARDEFVVPADVVSHLGNGSSDAGAKQLYTMMDRVRQARTGNKRQGKEINASRFVPA